MPYQTEFYHSLHVGRTSRTEVNSPGLMWLGCRVLLRPQTWWRKQGVTPEQEASVSILWCLGILWNFLITSALLSTANFQSIGITWLDSKASLRFILIGLLPVSGWTDWVRSSFMKEKELGEGESRTYSWFTPLNWLSFANMASKIKRCLLLGGKVMTNLDSILKSRDITLPTKFHQVKAMVFPVVMYGFQWSCMELDYKESWSPKNWCFWTVVLQKTLESPWDCKEIPPVHPKGNQSWMFIGRTDAEAETPILWPPDAKSWLIGKDPDAGKDWRLEEKGSDNTELGGWIASPTQSTLVWVSSGSWWWIERPGVLQSTGMQRVRHDWTTELN